MYKLPYLLQIYSIKYTGDPFIPSTKFIRQINGPISIDISSALDNLEHKKYIHKDVVENTDYGHPRYSYSLKKKLKKGTFSEGEMIFLDNFLSELLPLTQKKLKELAYKSEPMVEIQSEEKKTRAKKIGKFIDFSSVSVDPDVVEVYADSQ
jgi:hypothetical protein